MHILTFINYYRNVLIKARTLHSALAFLLGHINRGLSRANLNVYMMSISYRLSKRRAGKTHHVKTHTRQHRTRTQMANPRKLLSNCLAAAVTARARYRTLSASQSDAQKMISYVNKYYMWPGCNRRNSAQHRTLMNFTLCLGKSKLWSRVDSNGIKRASNGTVLCSCRIFLIW